MKNQILLLLIFTTLTVMTGCSSVGNKTLNQSNRFSILQGMTTSTTTEINILVNKKDPIQVSLIDNKTKNQIKETTTNDHFINESEWGVKKIYYSNLSEQSDYSLEVKSSNGLFDTRNLSTLNLSMTKPKIAILSCMDDEKKIEQKIMWEGLISQDPNIIFLIGDQVYADWKNGKKLPTPMTMAQVWNRYVDSRLEIDFYKSKKLFPTLAMWDDHDYGINDGDETNPIKDELRNLFTIFYSQNVESSSLLKGPSISFVFKAFNQNFYFLDNRSFRTPNQKPLICDNENKKNHKFCNKTFPNPSINNQTIYGKETENWLINSIKNSDGVNWLISGDQFFGAYHPFESYEGTHSKSFHYFLNQLKQTNKKVLFVSGDRHLSEIMKIEKDLLNYETFEITSSGMHSVVFPSGWDEFPNPRQIAGIGQTLNYSMIEPEQVGNSLKISVHSIGPLKKILYSKDLILKN